MIGFLELDSQEIIGTMPDKVELEYIGQSMEEPPLDGPEKTGTTIKSPT